MLLTSVLSIMQMPEVGRQIICGLVIILMPLAFGRQDRVTSCAGSFSKPIVAAASPRTFERSTPEPVTIRPNGCFLPNPGPFVVNMKKSSADSHDPSR